jgi:hypothetical protein
MDKLLEIVLLRIGDISEILGPSPRALSWHSEIFFEEPALKSALEEMGLRNWLAVFDSELFSLWTAGKNGVRFIFRITLHLFC